MQHQLAGRFQPSRQIGEPETDRLMLDDRFAHRAALLGIADGDFQRRLRHADALRRDADAAGFQVGQRQPVALPFRAKQIFVLEEQILEADRAGIGGALPQLVLYLVDAIAGPVRRRQEAGNALLAAAGSVTANTIATPAILPEVMVCLAPFSFQPPGTFTERVEIAAASDPASVWVSAKAPIIRPDIRPGGDHATLLRLHRAGRFHHSTDPKIRDFATRRHREVEIALDMLDAGHTPS